MNLLQMILDAQSGGAVQQVSNRLGIDQSQASSAIAQLLPALTGGMKRNLASSGGVESLLGALQRGNHKRYLDNPAELASDSAIQDGNGILAHLLGSKDASRAAARQASAGTGLDEGILKKMLPMVAAMAMGSLSKQTSSGNLQSALGQARAAGGTQLGEVGGALSRFLDSDGDGSIADDLMGIAKKFL